MSRHICTLDIKAARKQRWAELSVESKKRSLEGVAAREITKAVPFASMKVSKRLELMETETFKNASPEVREVATESLENRKKFENA